MLGAFKLEAKIRAGFLLIRPAACFAMIVVFASMAEAQKVPSSIEDPAANAPIRLGVIALEPRVTMTNLGVDTNVFNAHDNPVGDFTFTASPGTRLWMRTGRGLFTVDAAADFVYFSEYHTERAVNSNASGLYEFRFNRFRPYVSAATLNTSQRPGYEIDARARHYETEFHAGADLRTGSKGEVRFDTQRLLYEFAGDEVFNGRPLNQELNRTLSAATVKWRQRLTALTTWVTTVAAEGERFEYADTRNSDSFRVSSGFELGRFALIRGTAFVGYRWLKPADAGTLPEFSGVTSDVNVAYTMPTQTRLGATVLRDIQYSYENSTPYYIQTGVLVTLTQRLTGRWDFQLAGGRDRLSYQSVIDTLERTDKVGRFGGGIGYALGEGRRISFDVDSMYRRSRDSEREFGSIRAGVSVSYDY